MHDHTFPSDKPTGHDAQRAPLPKSRAARRAHGQRNTSPRVHSARLHQAPRAETGAQRAQRRAAARGLIVGRSVAAQCHGWLGLGDPPSSRHYVPREERAYAGPGGATPLGRVDRLARYLLQREATTHQRQGSGWQPTDRQRRRLDHKARHAAAPFGPKSPTYVPSARGPAASAVILDDPPREIVTNLATGEQRTEPLSAPVSPQEFVKPERERSAINRNGYRVVDRRGEHR